MVDVSFNLMYFIFLPCIRLNPVEKNIFIDRFHFRFNFMDIPTRKGLTNGPLKLKAKQKKKRKNHS